MGAGAVTPAERASLNRAAAELAGWHQRQTVAGIGYTKWLDAEGEDHFTAEGDLPDFTADPALWWPLVERFIRLEETHPGSWWVGPFRRGGRWSVEYYVAGQGRGEVQDEEAGAAVVRAALAVAAALGLGGGEGTEKEEGL